MSRTRLLGLLALTLALLAISALGVFLADKF